MTSDPLQGPSDSEQNKRVAIPYGKQEIEDYEDASPRSLPPLSPEAAGDSGLWGRTARAEDEPAAIDEAAPPRRARGLEIGTYNSSHLTFSKGSQTNEESDASKTRLKVSLIARLFAKNRWLDALVLQEYNETTHPEEPARKVNRELQTWQRSTRGYGPPGRPGAATDGQEEMPREPTDRAEIGVLSPISESVGMEPPMESSAGEPMEVEPSDSVPETLYPEQPSEDTESVIRQESGIRMESARGHYYEHYLILYRKRGSIEKVIDRGYFPIPPNSTSDTAIELDKKANTYRPAVRFDLQLAGPRGKMVIKVAVVHTSPEGNTKLRKSEFEQVREVLEEANENSGKGPSQEF